MTESEKKRLVDLCKPLPELQELAKALWGESECDRRSGHKARGICLANHRGYQYHLQQMVKADDPLQYLAQHLEGEQG